MNPILPLASATRGTRLISETSKCSKPFFSPLCKKFTRIFSYFKYRHRVSITISYPPPHVLSSTSSSSSPRSLHLISSHHHPPLIIIPPLARSWPPIPNTPTPFKLRQTSGPTGSKQTMAANTTTNEDLETLMEVLQSQVTICEGFQNP